jgi:thiamine pyrophosphate-dependent acetolactate synthase large subunit-like protein
MSKLTGARLIVDALVNAGVRHLFTVSGHRILGIFGATRWGAASS